MNVLNMIKILNGLKVVMSQVIESKKELAMSNYFLDGSMVNNLTDIHNCGTAACVVGYASLDNTFLKLVRTILPTDTIIGEAADLWYDLETIEEENGNAFKDTPVLDSLFNTSGMGRMDDAIKTQLFSNEELDNINHLNDDIEPTPADVIDYLDLLISKIST